MRFAITVADPETGEEFVLAVEAETEREAVAKANAAGYLAAEVVPIPVVADGLFH